MLNFTTTSATGAAAQNHTSQGHASRAASYIKTGQSAKQYSNTYSDTQSNIYSNTYNNTYSNANTYANTNNTGITEVVLPEQQHLSMVLPTLAHLSHQAKDRWFTWFAPLGLNKALLQQYNFNLPNVRLVHTKNQEQQLWYAWEALAEGNNHIVVASLGKLEEKRFHQLENAARIGQCSGLLIRYR